MSLFEKRYPKLIDACYVAMKVLQRETDPDAVSLAAENVISKLNNIPEQMAKDIVLHYDIPVFKDGRENKDYKERLIALGEQGYIKDRNLLSLLHRIRKIRNNNVHPEDDGEIATPRNASELFGKLGVILNWYEGIMPASAGEEPALPRHYNAELVYSDIINIPISPEKLETLTLVTVADGKLGLNEERCQQSCHFYNEESFFEAAECINSLSPNSDCGAPHLVWALLNTLPEIEYSKAVFQNNLGVCYCEGLGVKQDRAKGLYLFGKAAAQGLREAQYNIGFCYYFESDIRTIKDKEVAAFLFRKAAEQGLVEAQFQLGGFFALGIGVSKDGEEAVSWYEKAAKQGLLEAQCKVAESYASGIDVQENGEKALYWYEKAAMQGDLAAQNIIADCYDDGNVPKHWVWNIPQTTSDNNGNGKKTPMYRRRSDYLTYSRYNSASEKLSQKGVLPKDNKKAAYWYEKAAEQGSGHAQFKIAFFYYDGIGVEQDFKKSIYWYEKFTDVLGRHPWGRNEKACEYIIGLSYYDGIGVQQDYKEAARRFITAASSASHVTAWETDAAYRLASMYENGKGVEKDYHQAIEWYTQAAQQGDIDAQKRIKRVRRKMPIKIGILKSQDKRKGGFFFAVMLYIVFLGVYNFLSTSGWIPTWIPARTFQSLLLIVLAFIYFAKTRLYLRR